MATDKNQRYERGLKSLANTLFRRGGDWQVVSHYSVGDLNTEKNLYISNNGCLVGNVGAPRIVIAGAVIGQVTAKEIIVESGGQIWGDVLGNSMELGTGSKLHGWFSTLDEGTVELLLLGDLDLGDLPVPKLEALQSDLISRFPEINKLAEVDKEKKESNEIWRQLRAEAATAVAARAEIEAAFETRLDEAKRAFELSGSVESGGMAREELVSPDGDEPVASDLNKLIRELEETRLEKERYEDQLDSVINQARIYYNRYLWSKANLDSTKKALAEYQGISPVNLSAFIDFEGTDVTSSIDENALFLARNEQLAHLRSVLVERDIEIHKLKSRIRELELELKNTIRIATNKIRELEGNENPI